MGLATQFNPNRKTYQNQKPSDLITGLIGLAYPLFNSFLPLYLSSRFSTSSSVSVAYRNYVIISIMGIPGSIIACLVVDWTRKKNQKKEAEGGQHEENNDKRFRQAEAQKWSFWQGLTVVGGRKLTLAVSTLLTGVFLFLFTTSRNQADFLGFSCASGITQYVYLFLSD